MLAIKIVISLSLLMVWYLWVSYLRLQKWFEIQSTLADWADSYINYHINQNYFKNEKQFASFIEDIYLAIEINPYEYIFNILKWHKQINKFVKDEKKFLDLYKFLEGYSDRKY